MATPPTTFKIAGVGLRACGWNPPPVTAAAPTPLAFGLSKGFRVFRAGGSRFAATIPASWSWRTQGKTTPIFDQGQGGSCVGAGVAAGCYTGMIASNIPFDGIPSPGITWKGTKDRERSMFLLPGAGTTIPMPAIVDGGCGTADALLWLAQEGVTKMTTSKTPDGRFYDLWTPADVAGIKGATSNVSIELSVDELALARQKLLLGPSMLDTGDPSFVLNLKSALLLGPVWWGGTVDSQVFNFTSTSVPVSPFIATDPNQGGHLMCIQGWRPSVLGDGTDDWEVQDSWGEDYGDTGYLWARQTWAQSGSDVYAANVLKAP